MHWWEARLTTVIHYTMELLINKCSAFREIQNTLCRIVTRTHRFSSVTGPLMSLHWLPVKSCVQFKVCLMTYKVYKNKYPAYLEDCVQPYRSIYNTRHSEPTRHMLTIPHYDYKRHRSFKHLSNSFYPPAISQKFGG